MVAPHPIPYQGSKRHLAPFIIGYFPKDANRLIEPFAGSAAVSLAAAIAGKVDYFILNDINSPLIDLWRDILDQPDRLANMYEKLWRTQQGRERQFYDLVRLRFNKTHQPYYLLYLLARCVKASVRYNANGEFNQSPDNRRKGRQPNSMRQDIRQTSQLLQRKTTLLSESYQKAVERALPTDIIYMDPPYQGVCANRDPRYIEGVVFDELVEILDWLNVRQISFILSYDGRTGGKSFGKMLPDVLQLKRIEVNAGRSSQATLLGRSATTFESLYLSPALLARIGMPLDPIPQQLSLFGELV